MAEHSLKPIKSGAEDLAWMEGRWLGERSGDTVEEHWSGASAGTIMAMFRWIQSGTVKFYELIAVEEEAGGLVMRIKHFDPGLGGWEEKHESVACDLVELTDRQAVWLIRADSPKWLIYQRAGYSLEAWFERPADDPSACTRFAYRLV